MEKAIFLPNPEIKREQCIEQCNGCNKIYSDENIGNVCIAYVNPNALFRLGECALKSNKVIEKDTKKKINPIKMSKRLRRRGVR